MTVDKLMTDDDYQITEKLLRRGINNIVREQ